MYGMTFSCKFSLGGLKFQRPFVAEGREAEKEGMRRKACRWKQGTRCIKVQWLFVNSQYINKTKITLFSLVFKMISMLSNYFLLFDLLLRINEKICNQIGLNNWYFSSIQWLLENNRKEPPHKQKEVVWAQDQKEGYSKP